LRSSAVKNGKIGSEFNGALATVEHYVSKKNIGNTQRFLVQRKVYCFVAQGKEDGDTFTFWLAYKGNLRFI